MTYKYATHNPKFELAASFNPYCILLAIAKVDVLVLFRRFLAFARYLFSGCTLFSADGNGGLSSSISSF